MAARKVLIMGAGGQLARHCIGSAAYAPLDPVERARQLRCGSELSAKVLRSRKITRLRDGLCEGGEGRHTPRVFSGSAALKDGPEPQGMFKQLLLSDLKWATEPTAEQDLQAVREHRWTFRGAFHISALKKILVYMPATFTGCRCSILSSPLLSLS